MAEPNLDLSADIARQVADAADDFQIRRARGEDPDPEEYAARYPDAADAIRGVLDLLRWAMPPSAVGNATADLAAPGGDTQDGKEPSSDDGLPRPGSKFGPFDVLAELGRGGMGAVFRAVDPELRRQVALKVMLPATAARPGTRDRFLREARALAAVHHDHIVPVYQVGEADGVPFLIMPLLAGETLADRVRREGALPTSDVAKMGREAAAGLAVLHARGLVHRDVKPANLWLEAPAGRVKLLDLGLAREANGADQVTAVGAIVGTPAYMSPEQVNGEFLDPRSDLFSLGSVLYEAATGQQAFTGKSMTAVLAAVGEKDPPAAADLNRAVPAGLSDLIARLHRKRPAERPASADEVADKLERLVRLGSAIRLRRRAALAAVAAAVLIAAVGGVGLAIANRPGRADDQQPGVPQVNVAAIGEPEGRAVAPAADPLRVRALDVRHFETEGVTARDRGVFGTDTFGAVFGDQIEIRARLIRPAYAYLIAFRPDGTDAVLFPQDDSDVPQPTDEPFYPAKRRDKRYYLTDGTGLWVVALVASVRPLPTYRDWRTAHPGGPWKPTAGPLDVVYRDDGKWLEQFDPTHGAVRGTRGEQDAPQKAPLVGLVDWLKQQEAGAVVWAVGFTTGPKR